MDINKCQYYVLKVLCVIGNNLWGFLSFFMILGLCMDLSQKNYSTFQTDIPSLAFAFCLIWLCHFILYGWVKKVKVYNGIFANDPDGVLQSKVVARALGITEEKVASEISLLCRMKLLKNCTLESDYTIILSGESADLAYSKQLQTVICPHCGGENHIRKGFVHSCQYCSGSLEEGKEIDVSE